MNFWARQAEARQRSRWLIAIFIAAVLAIVLAVNFVVLSLFALLDTGQPVVADTLWLARHPQAAVITTLVVLAIISIANLYKTMSLSAGGGAVARALGGLRVQADTSDPLQQRLVHVVEEMAIASGVPVPAVYVLEQEEGINAFAAGHTPANAAITVTRGALQNLNRAELQGVIGHEFSHILNGDMRLNIRIIGLLFGLLVIAIAGRTVSWYAPRGSDSRRSGGGLLIVAGVLIMALGYVGVFFGRLIQAAVSRQRELLADASAVQFTRDTDGLRDALLKIGSVRGSRLRHPDAEEVAHMLFAPGMTRWFATHPPLLARIRALDPGFDPAQFDNLRLEVKPQPLGVVEVVSKDRLPRSFYTGQIGAHRSVPLQPAALPGLIGNPGARELAHARSQRESLNDKFDGDDGDHLSRATALLFALVLDAAPAVRSQQLQKVRASFGVQLETHTIEQTARIVRLDTGLHLALLNEIVPVLRQLPTIGRRRILECLGALCRTDGITSVFEYAVCTLARSHIGESLEPKHRARPATLAHAGPELQILLSTLAAHGHTKQEAAAQACHAGMTHLGLTLAFNPVPGWSGALDRALRCLDGLPPAEKARLVEAMGMTIVHDGQVMRTEAELLRAICALLHCPLPPLVKQDPAYLPSSPSGGI
ncbi:MAG: M48 family metallopeptidase [Chromatiales bacterium]|jgi:Zn-dependent protease with chaperone function|nr:M48 family metallopeptidase [Chromatiales bacterium]